MKLHSRDQSREGEQEAQKPVSAWQPQRPDYLQFLVDSRHVYQCFEEIVANTPEFESLRNSGLERSEALDVDIAWFAEQGVQAQPVGARGKAYVELLRSMANEGQWEAFICHFYNFYFAHTAGGQMIGKMMAEKLLDSRTLNFYQWDGDVKKELLPRLRGEIDAMAARWTRDQKNACLQETARSFQYGGALLQYISQPPSA